jgi:hypothetical protein
VENDQNIDTPARPAYPFHIVETEPETPPAAPKPRRKHRKRAPTMAEVAAKVELAHLGTGFAKESLATPALAAEAGCEDVSDARVESYDLDKSKKRIVVLAHERIAAALISPLVGILDKGRLALASIAQLEGTRREIIWDKRVVDDKNLLEQADRLARQIQTYAKKLPAGEVARLQMEAAEKIVKDLGGAAAGGAGNVDPS